MLLLPSALFSALHSQKQAGLTAAPTCSSTRVLSLWFKASSLRPVYIAGLCYNEISQKTFCRGHLFRPFSFLHLYKRFIFQRGIKRTKKGNGNGTLTQTHSPFLLLPDQPQPGAKTFTWGAREAAVSRRVQKWQ